MYTSCGVDENRARIAQKEVGGQKLLIPSELGRRVSVSPSPDLLIK